MKNRTESIRKMVNYLNNEEKDGGYWLPNIQRPFVWKEDQIERLFDSIMREYPISTLLIWRTDSNIRRRKFIDNFKVGLKLTDYYIPVDDKVKMLVLDGQQRLQSLFIGLKGSYQQKELYMDMLSGHLVSPEDIRFRFKFFVSSPGLPWIKFKDVVFDKDVPNKLGARLLQESDNDFDDSQKERFTDNVWKISQMFTHHEAISFQELDSVDDPSTYTEDDVVEIFIRANAGGTKLGKSDLLFSLLTSSWADSEEQMEDLLAELNKTGYDFTRDFILKSCLVMLGKGARYDVAKFRDGNTKESIVEKWKELSAAIKDVKDFLYGKTFIRTDRALPSYLGLIPLIYFRFNYPDQWKNTQSIDQYILRTLMAGAFSGTPDNLIDKCVRRIDEMADFDMKQIFGVIREDGRSLEITSDSILRLHYGSKDIHLLFNLWYRNFNYSPSFQNSLPQIDHIFPQSKLKRYKVANPETGVVNMLKYHASERDQLANCMLLTAEENGAGGKSDQSPEEWFLDKDDAYLKMHLIPENQELWKMDNFEEFLAARKDLILERFEGLIQKNE